MFRLLISNRFKASVAALRRGGWAQVAVIAAFGAIGSAIFISAFLLFLRAFRFLGADPEVGGFVTEYVLGASFAVTFFLGAASFIASAPWFFHRSGELSLLFALPIDPVRIYAYRYAMAAASAGWPVVLIALPGAAAFVITNGSGLVGFLFALTAVLLFTVAISVCGALLAFLLTPLTRRLNSPLLWAIEAIALVVAFVGVAKRIAPRSLLVLFERAASGETEFVRRRLDEMFAWFPSAPFVRMLMDGVADPGAALAGLIVVIAVLILAIATLVGLVAGNYRRDWQSHGDRTSPAPSAARHRPFPRFFRLGHGFLLEKDLLLLVRDGGEMARAASLGALLVFFIFSLRAVTGMSAFGSPRLFAFAVVFAFAAVGYLALTFCMRFVFPAFSLEGRGAWAVMSSPIHLHELYSWKLFFWSGAVTLLTVPAVAFTAMFFGLPTSLSAFMIFSACCSSVAVVAMTLGQGTLYPRFRERNPDLIATSPAGLAATILGVAYLAVIARYVHAATVATLAGEMIPVKLGFGVLVVSLALVAAYWAAVSRRLDRMEMSS